MYALVGWHPAPSPALDEGAADSQPRARARRPRPAPEARLGRPHVVPASKRANAAPSSIHPVPKVATRMLYLDNRPETMNIDNITQNRKLKLNKYLLKLKYVGLHSG